MAESTSTTWIYAAAALAVILWGASPVGTKVALAEVSPLGVMTIRTLGGGVGGMALAIILSIRPPRHLGDMIQVALAGACGMIAFPTLFSLGMQATSAAHGAMILACMPVTTSAIAFVVDRKMPTGFWWLGCGLAIAGEAILVSGWEETGTGVASFEGDLLVLSSTFFACIGYVLGGKLQKRGYPARGITFWGAAFSAAVLIPFSPWLMVSVDATSWTGPTWFALGYLAFGVTILGYICWYWALGHGGVSRISLMQFLQPVSGLALSIAFLDDHLSLQLVIAAALIFAGTIISTRGVSR